MPSSLIRLDDSRRSFVARYGDFVTVPGDAWTNADRLAYAVLVTAGAASEEAESIPDPFDEGALYPDERVWYFESRLPVQEANGAALLATGFPWAKQAADAAKQYPVPAAVVERIREAMEKVHRQRTHVLRHCLNGGTEWSRLQELLTQVEEEARGVVSWRSGGS